MFRQSKSQQKLVRRSSLLVALVAAACVSSSCALIKKASESFAERVVSKWEESEDEKHIDIRRFNVSPASVAAGAEAKLAWDVDGADEVTIEPGIGAVAHAGQAVVRPTSDTIYTLEAKYQTGRKPKSCQVTVVPAGSPPGGSTGPAPGSGKIVIGPGSDPRIREIVIPPVTPQPAPAPKPAPKPAAKPTPADERWEVRITFTGAVNLHSSNEAEAEVYVAWTARGGVERRELTEWKSITDRDEPTFLDHGYKRLSGQSVLLEVDGDDPISFQLVFHERDGDYHPCATFGESFANVRQCTDIDTAADGVWVPTTRYPGDYGDMDFVVAYKVSARQIQ